MPRVPEPALLFVVPALLPADWEPSELDRKGATENDSALQERMRAAHPQTCV